MIIAGSIVAYFLIGYLFTTILILTEDSVNSDDAPFFFIFCNLLWPLAMPLVALVVLVEKVEKFKEARDLDFKRLIMRMYGAKVD